MLSKTKTVIYDLDGTLVDSMPGIASSFRHTFKVLGRSEPGTEEIRLAIGPGLHKALESLMGTSDPEQVEEAVRIYRRHHDSEGFKATTFIPGMLELAQELHQQGITQFVASMKSETIVKPILQYLECMHLFKAAVGANAQGKTKSKAEMLHALGDEFDFKVQESVLVGDTLHDAKAAKEANSQFVGVTFGYGTEEEIRGAQWGMVVASVSELRKVLLEAAVT